MKKNIHLSIVLLVFFSFTSTSEKQSFSPGEIWPDEQGIHINAHGGGILYFHDKYYWFGEHKVAGTLGNTAQVGVGCYSSLTFHSQGTFVLPVAGKKDALIFLADRWNPENHIDGRYIWLPIFFKDGKPMLAWMDTWDLGVFAKNEYF